MSIHAIKAYQSEVENIIHYGGTRKEMSIRNAFQHLLNEYAKQKGLLLIGLLINFGETSLKFKRLANKKYTLPLSQKSS